MPFHKGACVVALLLVSSDLILGDVVIIITPILHRQKPHPKELQSLAKCRTAYELEFIER